MKCTCYSGLIRFVTTPTATTPTKNDIFGISYVLRCTNGILKIGHTQKGTRGLESRLDTHRKAELERGNGVPNLIRSFEASQRFDLEIIDRFKQYRTNFGKDWFHPAQEVVSVVERVLSDVDAGRPAVAYTEEERAANLRKCRAGDFLVMNLICQGDFSCPHEEDLLNEYGGVDVVQAHMERIRPAELRLIADLQESSERSERLWNELIDLRSSLPKVR